MSKVVTTKPIDSVTLSLYLGVNVVVRGADGREEGHKEVEADVDLETLEAAVEAHEGELLIRLREATIELFQHSPRAAGVIPPGAGKPN